MDVLPWVFMKTNIFLSNCTDTQMVFHTISDKVMESAFEKTKEILQAKISACQSDKAWTNPSSNHFKKCNREIGASIGRVWKNLKDIENFVANNINFSMPAEFQIGQLMEGVDPYMTDSIGIVIDFLQDASSSFEIRYQCSDLEKGN